MSYQTGQPEGTALHEPLELPAPEEHKLLPAPPAKEGGGADHARKQGGGGRRKLLLFCIVVVAIFLLILLLGWIPRHNRNKEANAKANAQRDALPVVTVIRVEPDTSGSGIAVPGTTTPLTEAYVYARANGYLKKRFADIGDHVHRGQLLAIIDAPDLDQQVDQAREQLRQAEAQKAQQETQLALTKVTFDRYSALVARGVFSRQDGDQAEANYLAQVANVASADRNVQAFRANLARQIALQSYERVTSPFAGTVTDRNVDVGALIQASGSAGTAAPAPAPAGQVGVGSQGGNSNTGGASGASASLATPSTGGAGGGALFGIAQTQRLRVLVSVPEGYANAIKVGQHTVLDFQEYPDTHFFGDVTRTAGNLDENTRTLLTEVQVDNRNGKLMSGMYAVVTFTTNSAGSGKGPLTIPGDAVSIRQDRPTVAVIQNDTVHLQPVVLGRDYGPVIEIVGGLHQGDVIATTINDDVVEGARVKTVADKTANTHAKETQQAARPGGSTQYSDPGIADQDTSGKNGKAGQKGGGKNGTPKKGNSSGESRP